ncbi:FAD binding domain-containing protein [Christensenellaceae bacterium OttesenSCG-928-M15]|nr:FAD binding domain-containing protein [Christensenellaceae bacterium OttesenSCG-928-M15]
MKHFAYERAASFEEAGELLKANRQNKIISGGTDILGGLKDDILQEYPETLVDIKKIPGADMIEIQGEALKIGALAKLNDVANSPLVQKHAPILCEAAKTVATPLIRSMGTIGGNVMQDVRCWFYRYPHEVGGRLHCSRKGGDTCYALQGDNRYHTIFGGMKAHTTPCTQECPAGTDIPAYMEELRLGNWAAAASIIMKVNPMPMITSRVCAHFCQDNCNRCHNDESVAISNVERSVGDYILKHSDRFYKAPETSTGESVAIVGAGPSGLSAAYFLLKAGNDVTVYDSKEEPGGMLMYAIPAYRLPKDIVRQFTGALNQMGAKFVCNTQVGKDIMAAELEKKYDSVYYATGAWKRRVIGLSGEELTTFGLDFLIEVNRWMEGKVGSEVLVTGGGNVAMDVAITAKRLGAKKVTMACVEPREKMPASKEEIARAEEEGIVIMPGWGLSKVVEESGAVKGMELKRCTSVTDETGRFHPQYDENDKMVVNADSILMAVGQLVDLSFIDEKYQMELNRRGLIDVAEDTQMTSRPGVFAGGDATIGPATVVQAVAHGRKAANGMCRYMEVEATNGCSGGPEDRHKQFITFDPVAAKKKEAVKLRELPAEERDIEKEDAFTLPTAEALEEAGRCLNCGCYAVNPSDIAPTLVALGATVVTNKRRVAAEDFCCNKLKAHEALELGEVVTGFEIPVIEGANMHYDKFRLRDSVDFAIVSASTLFSTEKGKLTGAKIVLGGVAPVPVRAHEAEGFLLQKEITEEIAEKAADVALKDALPMANNAYKIVEIKAMLKKAILRMQ